MKGGRPLRVVPSVMSGSYLGVSKNRGTPKWMVYNGKTLLKWIDLGVPLFFETPIWFSSQYANVFLFYYKPIFPKLETYFGHKQPVDLMNWRGWRRIYDIYQGMLELHIELYIYIL